MVFNVNALLFGGRHGGGKVEPVFRTSLPDKDPIQPFLFDLS
jgi:hypothetical protein